MSSPLAASRSEVRRHTRQQRATARASCRRRRADPVMGIARCRLEQARSTRPQSRAWQVWLQRFHRGIGVTLRNPDMLPKSDSLRDGMGTSTIAFAFAHRFYTNVDFHSLCGRMSLFLWEASSRRGSKGECHFRLGANRAGSCRSASLVAADQIARPLERCEPASTRGPAEAAALPGRSTPAPTSALSAWHLQDAEEKG